MFSLHFACLLMATALAGVLGDRELHPIELECIQANNLDPEEVKKFEHYDPIPLDNQAMLKIQECWSTELNLFDLTGKLDYSVLKKIFEESIASLNTPEMAEEKAKVELYYSKIDVCSAKSIEGASQAQTGIKFHNCIIEEMANNEVVL